MKKWLTALLCVLLTLAMVLTLAACGEDSKKKSKDDEDEDDEKTSENGGTDEDEDSDSDKEDDTDKDDEKDDTPAQGNRSISQAVNKYVTGQATGDAEMILNVMPQQIVDMYMEMTEASSFAELVEILEEDFNYDEDYYEIDRVSIEEISFEEHYQSEEDVIEELDSYYGISESDYDDIAVVEVTVEYDGEEDTEELVLILVDGNWCVVM